MKELMRTILTSHLYQLSSTPNETNNADTRNFSRFYRRRFGAEMMADAITDVTGVPSKYPGLAVGARADQAWTYKIDSRTMESGRKVSARADNAPRAAPDFVSVVYLLL